MPEKNAFRLRLALQQAAPPLEIAPGEWEGDLVGEIERTIAELETCDPVAVEEEIHVEFSAWLCRSCRDEILRRLKIASASPGPASIQ